MADVFISYAREDRAQVEALAEVFTRCGWSVWWDRHLPYGKSFSPEIARALQAARCAVVLWSRHSISADWVAIEAEEARERGILLPVYIEDVIPPIEFKRLHTANLLNWNPAVRHPGLEDLLTQLRKRLGGDGLHPPSPGVLPEHDHATILRTSVRVWNDWRTANPHVEPNLAGAHLAALDLSRVHLAGANLANANLSLSGLEHADLRNAVLAGANLSEARLRETNFKEADLTRADFRRAVFENTSLIGAKLAGAKHLETTIHLDTSHLDDRALSSSPGLAAHFLRGCGLTEAEIARYEQHVHR
ncbi:MAG TPA: TIR domain-containing protein [Thermoanaerobaculia bacterium]|nr:TIR domain-containing protein [Thermoanaerobaculia bacterium]